MLLIRNLSSLCLLWVAFAAPTVSADPLSCKGKYDRYAEAQTNWQNDSAEIAAKLLPAHKDRIYSYREAQLIAIERRQLAVHLALQHLPEQVSIQGSINQWLDYSPELEQKLSKLSPEFKALSEKYYELTSPPAEGDGDGDGDNFHITFRKTVLADEGFMALMHEFNNHSREINTLSCQL